MTPEQYAIHGERAFQPRPPDMGGAGAAAGEMFDRGSKIVIGAAAVKAGTNHYQQTGDAMQSLQVGAIAYVRWMVWFLALCLWVSLVVINGINGGLGATMRGDTGAVTRTVMTAAFLFGISPFTFGVNWCRNIDFCLFRRGLIYRLYAPIAQVTEPVPTWALYVILLVPVVL